MRPVRVLIAVMVLIVAGAAVGGCSTSAQGAADIATSGFIEATDIAIAPELAGRIVEITASEGYPVKAGVPLVRLDDSLLQAQQRQAEAAVAQAQAAAEQSQAMAEQAQAAVNQAAMSRDLAAANRDGARKALDNALDAQKQPLSLDAAVITAQGQADAARYSLELATDNFRKLTYPYTYSTFAFDVPTASGYIGDAQSQIQEAQKGLQPGLSSDQVTAAMQQLQKAMDNLAKGQALLTRGQGQDVFQSGVLTVKDFWTLRAAQLQMDQAKAALDTANKALQNAQDARNNPLQLNAAVDGARSAYNASDKALGVAESAVTLAQKQAVVSQRQAAVAQKQIDQARSALEVIKVQMGKLALTSPVSGVVASRNSEVGEIAQPGAPILTITQLDPVTLTAYVPESRIGLVKLGEKALVSVDSYPGEEFSGVVTFISPGTIFTPGNVQLKDEREKTVFSVKISLPNPDQKLKPGMPADAVIRVSP